MTDPIISIDGCTLDRGYPMHSVSLGYFTESNIPEAMKWQGKSSEKSGIQKVALELLMHSAARNGTHGGITVSISADRIDSHHYKKDEDIFSGYCLFSRGIPDLRIEHISVWPGFRRVGLGRLMIQSLMGMIEDPSKPRHPVQSKFRPRLRLPSPEPVKRKSLRNSLEISVDEYNTPAHLFLQKVGFSAFGVEDGKYKFIRFAE